MPMHDIDAMNESLDGDYGSGHSGSSPASHDLALFFSDPMLVSDPTTVELDGTNDPGYARVTINNDSTWAAAAGAQKALAAGPAVLPDTTGAWLHTATHWGLYGADGKWWDCGPFQSPIVVTAASTGPAVSPVIFYSDSLTPA